MAESSHWIAIVDDDPSVLSALSRSLRIRGFGTKAFRSAQAFLASLTEGRPDCLIVDLQMPEMTGLDLFQHLRNSNIRIPTIIITAHGDAIVRERTEAAGVVAFLEKPLQKTALFAAIDAARRAAGA